MRRVSEGFLAGENQLCDVLMSLPNGLARFGLTSDYPEKSLNPVLKKTYFKRTCDPAGVALRVTGNRLHRPTVRKHPNRIAKRRDHPFEWVGQSLLHPARFVATGRGEIYCGGEVECIPPICSGREAIR